MRLFQLQRQQPYIVHRPGGIVHAIRFQQSAKPLADTIVDRMGRIAGGQFQNERRQFFPVNHRAVFGSRGFDQRMRQNRVRNFSTDLRRNLFVDLPQQSGHPVQQMLPPRLHQVGKRLREYRDHKAHHEHHHAQPEQNIDRFQHNFIS